VFLDPPYLCDDLQKSINKLVESNLVRANGWVYAEYSLHTDPPVSPEYWLLHRSTQAGNAKANLYLTTEI